MNTLHPFDQGAAHVNPASTSNSNNSNNNTSSNDIPRRDFGKRLGQVAAASALAGLVVPTVHAAGDSTIQVALVGGGGRGTGAAGDALKAKGVNPRLVAMADAFEDRLKTSYKTLKADP